MKAVAYPKREGIFDKIINSQKSKNNVERITMVFIRELLTH